jgi:hypothetical protein
MFYRQQTILNSYSSSQEGLAPAAGALHQCKPLIVACNVVSLRCHRCGVVRVPRGIGPGARGWAFRQCEPPIVACGVVLSQCHCHVSCAQAVWYQPWRPRLGLSANANCSLWHAVSWCRDVVIAESCTRRVVSSLVPPAWLGLSKPHCRIVQ